MTTNDVTGRYPHTLKLLRRIGALEDQVALLEQELDDEVVWWHIPWYARAWRELTVRVDLEWRYWTRWVWMKPKT